MSVQLILKNSGVQDKIATASQLEIGEIALNWHESGPFLHCKDSSGQIWRIGGVIVAPEAPGQPSPGTWWFETDTRGLYFFDGTSWTEITGSGGGTGGDITGVVAGEGLTGGGTSGTVTIDADLDLTRGMQLISDGVAGSKIAVKPGANISFDTDGSLRSDVASISVKGTVDLTSATIPSPAAANDAYFNIAAGTMSAAWQAATGESHISVEGGDTVIYDGTGWKYIPAAPGQITSVFGRIGQVVATEGDYSLDLLGDVDLTTVAPSDDDLLQYDSATSTWYPVPASSVGGAVESVYGRTGAVIAEEGDYSLDLLSDVNLTTTTPSANDILQYNGATSEWVPAALPTGAVASVFSRTGNVIAQNGDYDLGELGDVDLTTAAPTAGEFLKYDGTNWVPDTVTAGVSSIFGRSGAVIAQEGDYTIDQLGDVDTLTSPPSSGDVLEWNGSNWVPATPSGASPVGAAGELQLTNGHGALTNATGLKWDSANTELEIPGNINLDASATFTTTIQTTTATANRVISFPDADGTVAVVSGASGAVQINENGGSGSSALAVDVTKKSFGYGSDGGTETQLTSKSTAVTLNKPTGQITMNGAAMAADTSVSFTLNNTSISEHDILVFNYDLNGEGDKASYVFNAVCSNGFAEIQVRNISTVSQSNALIVRFAVIRSVTT
jgi:hypothetical protein